MRRDHAYMRVYWAGTAIALEWDVALRRQSGGRVTLDHAVRELGRRFAGDGRVHDADDLIAHLDRWHGRPLFSRIAERRLAAHRFPDLTEVYAELQLDADTGSPRGEHALRDAIMRPSR